jgi:hypothetical protein
VKEIVDDSCDVLIRFDGENVFDGFMRNFGILRMAFETSQVILG